MLEKFIEKIKNNEDIEMIEIKNKVIKIDKREIEEISVYNSYFYNCHFLGLGKEREELISFYNCFFHDCSFENISFGAYESYLSTIELKNKLNANIGNSIVKNLKSNNEIELSLSINGSYVNNLDFKDLRLEKFIIQKSPINEEKANLVNLNFENVESDYFEIQDSFLNNVILNNLEINKSFRIEKSDLINSSISNVKSENIKIVGNDIIKSKILDNRSDNIYFEHNKILESNVLDFEHQTFER